MASSPVRFVLYARARSPPLAVYPPKTSSCAKSSGRHVPRCHCRSPDTLRRVRVRASAYGPAAEAKRAVDTQRRMIDGLNEIALGFRCWRRAEMAAARRGGRFLGNSRRRGVLARPSIAATPRSRRLSEQVAPRRLRGKRLPPTAANLFDGQWLIRRRREPASRWRCSRAAVRRCG